MVQEEFITLGISANRDTSIRPWKEPGQTPVPIPPVKQTNNKEFWCRPAVIRKCWARDGKWKAPWLHGQQLHYFQRWCFGLHSLFCKGPFQSSTSGWTSMNCWWIGPGWRSSPQQNTNHECCSWRERSTSQLIGYLDALFASSLSHRSLWLCQPVKQVEKNWFYNKYIIYTNFINSSYKTEQQE